MVRLFKGVVTDSADDLPGVLVFQFPVLLPAAVTDHGQIRDRRMTMLDVVFIHAVLFHLALHVFLHPVRCGI
jgi:hypothetical protein